MRAVAYRARRTLRRDWKALALLALAVGAVFGGAITAATAARRTASAYSRFSETSRAWDALYVNYPEDETAIFTPREMRAVPGVASVHRVLFDYAALGPGTGWMLDPTGRLGTDVARARLLDGRWFDTRKANEVVVSFALAEREGLSVGDTFELFPEQYLADAKTPDERAQVAALLRAVPDRRMHVVGVIAAPGEFPPVQVGMPLMHMSPALRAFADDRNNALLIRLHDGADAEAFRSALRARARDRGDLQLELHADAARAVNRSLRPQVVSLAVLALVLGVVGAVIAAQGVARTHSRDTAEAAALRALGVTRRDIVGTAALRWLATGAVAASIAVVVAVGLSPLSPTGLARLAEPDRGVHADVTMLLVGAGACVAVVLGAGVVLASAFAARARARRRGRARNAAPFTNPVIGLGVRGAFDRGAAGAVRAPLWSAIAGVTVGIAAIAAILTVGTTLDRQLDDPARYGLRWHAQLAQFTERTLVDDGTPKLARDRRVTALAIGFTDTTRVDGVATTFLAMDPVKGETRPPLVRGAYPDAADTVALGARTMRRLDVDVGDTTRLTIDEIGVASRRFRVVGEVIVPAQGTDSHLDDGIMMSMRGFDRIADDEAPAALFVALRPGVDVHTVVDDTVDRLQVDELPSVIVPPTPNDIVDLRRARSMPTAFAFAFAAVAAVALGGALVAGISHRRRDFAVFRVLGLSGRGLRGIALVQACTLTLLALAIGVPAGILVGRLAWHALANSIGSPFAAHTPIVAVALVVPAAAVTLAIGLSIAPGTRAARLRPADVLRSE